MCSETEGARVKRASSSPTAPPTGATELVFYDIMERGGDRKTLSILWTSGFLHPDDWGNQLNPESAAAPVSNSEAQQVGEGVSRKPWGERVPTSSTSLATCTGSPHLFPQRQLQPFGEGGQGAQVQRPGLGLEKAMKQKSPSGSPEGAGISWRCEREVHSSAQIQERECVCVCVCALLFGSVTRESSSSAFHLFILMI